MTTLLSEFRQAITVLVYLTLHIPFASHKGRRHRLDFRFVLAEGDLVVETLLNVNKETSNSCSQNYMMDPLKHCSMRNYATIPTLKI